MSNDYVIGAKINGRLNDHYHEDKGGALTEAQAKLARWIIKNLRRSCTDGCCAEGRVPYHGRQVQVRTDGARPSILIDGRAIQVNPVTEAPLASVGEIVCAAIRAGTPFDSGRDADAGNAEPTPTPEPTPEPDAEPDPEPDPEPKPRTPKQNDAQTLLEKLWALRDFCERGDGVADVISHRAVAGAAKMHYAAGIPTDAILHALTLTWTPAARQRNGIVDVDVADLTYRDPRPTPKVPADYLHPVFPYVSRLLDGGIMPFIVGPAGTGKGMLMRRLADERGLEFGMSPMTEGLSPAIFSGRHTPDGYKDTEFLRIIGGGGLFGFDELDAADPGMLLIVNDALSAREFHNPQTGEVIPFHDDCFPMAAANTWGTGADDSYVRNRLDAATQDRWRPGRVRMDYCRQLDAHLMGV